MATMDEPNDRVIDPCVLLIGNLKHGLKDDSFFGAADDAYRARAKALARAVTWHQCKKRFAIKAFPDSDSDASQILDEHGDPRYDDAGACAVFASPPSLPSTRARRRCGRNALDARRGSRVEGARASEESPPRKGLDAARDHHSSCA